MEDKPTIQYDEQGEVISEPNLEHRIRVETEDELAELQRRISGVTPSVGLPCGLPCDVELVDKLRRMVDLNEAEEEGVDCCAVTKAVKAVAEECGMDEIAGSDIDCCVRMSLARDLLHLHENLGG